MIQSIPQLTINEQYNSQKTHYSKSLPMTFLLNKYNVYQDIDQ
jgi:hypothetical protein